jgi:6-phosphogluconolactonase
MRTVATDAGRFAIGERDEVFRQAVTLAARAWDGNRGAPFFWALSGGSTPVEWYRWCVATGAINHALLGATEWFTSDERHVPLASGESNFGTADRVLLGPLQVPLARKHPWPVDLPAPASAVAFEERFRALRRADSAFDICFLGLGADGHTASLFPGSTLGKRDDAMFFAAVDVPEKGWRLTITPRGLRECGAVVVMALGEGKREALTRVLADDGSAVDTPARVLREINDKVTWLVDPAACAGILELG